MLAGHLYIFFKSMFREESFLVRDDVGSDQSKNREGNAKWSDSRQLSKMKQMRFADGLETGHGRKSEVRDFFKVNPVFRAGANYCDGEGLGGRGVWLDSETLGT